MEVICSNKTQHTFRCKICHSVDIVSLNFAPNSNQTSTKVYEITSSFFVKKTRAELASNFLWKTEKNGFHQASEWERGRLARLLPLCCCCSAKQKRANTPHHTTDTSLSVYWACGPQYANKMVISSCVLQNLGRDLRANSPTPRDCVHTSVRTTFFSYLQSPTESPTAW